ncbi:hypothetical protein [Companilactobacillus paralimentarius]|uniref:hypothetical protein n=1 Tax=Companilactobacillus paralimentarius TaxID=83526 RepID=UPI000A9F86AB|nr:hypothetical protein [Companilactobacillus paralimentarius]
MYPIYLLEDNELQRNKYAEFIHNGILINDANMFLEVVAGTTLIFSINIIQKNKHFTF